MSEKFLEENIQHKWHELCASRLHVENAGVFLQMQIQSLLPTHPAGHICLLKILSTFPKNEYQIEWSSF